MATYSASIVLLGSAFGVLIIFLIVAAGSTSLYVNGYATTFCSPNSVLSCTNGQSGGTQTVTYTCAAAAGECNLNCNGNTCSPACPTPLPIFTSCSPAGYWFLQGGQTITVTTAFVAGIYGTGSSANFNFSPIGVSSSDYIEVIVGVLAVAVLASITVVGSGLSPAAIRLLFLMGAVLGMWGLLSVAEGYVWGNNVSGFTSIDAVLPGAGGAVYAVLTIIVVLGSILLGAGGDGA